MSTRDVSAASEISDEVLHFPSHFRRPFADENPQRCPRKSCHFCFLPGKSTKVSGNPSPQGKTLGKNKRCKFQDERQQSGRTLAKFPDSLKNLWEETKIKKYRKNKCHSQAFWGWQNVGQRSSAYAEPNTTIH